MPNTGIFNHTFILVICVQLYMAERDRDVYFVFRSFSLVG